MARIDLSDQDLQVLLEVLESYLSDLRMEISHTDSFDFRSALKARKEALNRVTATLRDALEG